MKANAAAMSSIRVPWIRSPLLFAAAWLAAPQCAAGVRVVEARQAAASARDGHALRPLQPHEGHQVPLEQLRNIYSVDCLEEMQRNPRVRCSGPSQAKHRWPYVPSWGVFRKVKERHPEAATTTTTTLVAAPPEVESEPLSIANYPSWNEAQCLSAGEYFCDPEQLLEANVRKNLTDELRSLREQSEVKCGQLDSKLAAEDKTHYERFNLGVAIVGKWPSGDIDPVTLQKFGLVLMARWGLMPSYNGVDSSDGESNSQQYSDNCPNAAVLILLPEHGEVFLSSPSCEFICSERGGPEVMNAAIGALHREGLAAAAQEGMQQVRRIIKATQPLSLEEPAKRLSRRSAGRDWKEVNARVKDTVWVITQRVLLALIILSSIAAMGVFAAYNLVPGPREVRLKTREAS